ncbi:MAG: 5'-3' exonuclease [Mycoplasmataceae bacterium]|nr:5'-3' exonuclease [Mycoplasmataceae bacterium]
MKKALLIDGNALMYKAFYSSFFLMERGEGFDDKGRPINALRTFSIMILNLVERFNDSHVLVAFDEKGLETYRTKHSFYKAGRSKMPEELISQKPLIIKALDLSGVKHVSSPILEADDIIGTLSKKFSNNGIKVDIITSDKDFLQLVDMNINVHISKTGVSEMIEFTKDNFSNLFLGLNPNQIIDLKGIMGDSSDNLEGIKGIGEKGAVKLLSEYKNLESILENIKELTPVLQKKIQDGKKMGILCKSIATIIIDAKIDIEFETISFSPINREKLISFLREYSIHSVANRLEKKWL